MKGKKKIHGIRIFKGGASFGTSKRETQPEIADTESVVGKKKAPWRYKEKRKKYVVVGSKKKKGN